MVGIRATASWLRLPPHVCFADAPRRAPAAGNVTANAAADNLAVLDAALAQIPAEAAAGHRPNDDPGLVVRAITVRSDSAGCTAAFDCGQADERLTDTARLAAVTGGYSRAEVKVHRKSRQGIVAVSEAIARDVDIEGIGHIRGGALPGHLGGAGRGGSARARFDRRIRRGDLPGLGLVQAPVGAGATAAVGEGFNRVFSGQAECGCANPDTGSSPGHLVCRAQPGDRLLPGRRGRRALDRAVQAGTSYAIACLYDQGRDGVCTKAGKESVFIPADPARRSRMSTRSSLPTPARVGSARSTIRPNCVGWRTVAATRLRQADRELDRPRAQCGPMSPAAGRLAATGGQLTGGLHMCGVAFQQVTSFIQATDFSPVRAS
jgi:hypothetical protein